MTAAQNSGRATATVASAERRRRVRRARWLIAAAIAGLFAAWQAPLEIGRWQLAAALNLRAQGQTESAYERLNAAIARFRTTSALYVQRAEWRLADGQREKAFADCDRMVEVAQSSYTSLIARSQFLWNAGQFESAAEDWKKIEQFSQRSGRPDRHAALNGLAYAQALAGIELDEALANATEAIKMLPSDPENKPLRRDKLQQLLESRAAVFDTRGYIHYLKKQYDPALADMNTAVGYLAASLALANEDRQPRPATPQVFARFANSYPRTLQSDTARQVAAMYYHRALVLNALGREQEAQRDKVVVRRLIGRDGDETLF